MSFYASPKPPPLPADPVPCYRCGRPIEPADFHPSHGEWQHCAKPKDCPEKPWQILEARWSPSTGLHLRGINHYFPECSADRRFSWGFGNDPNGATDARYDWSSAQFTGTLSCSLRV